MFTLRNSIEQHECGQFSRDGACILQKDPNLTVIQLNGKVFQYFILFSSPKVQSKFKPIPFHNMNNLNCQATEIPLQSRAEKSVKFNLKPKIHIMYTWSFAYKQARTDIWQQCARDRARFERRIVNINKTLEPILKRHIRASEHLLNRENTKNT